MTSWDCVKLLMLFCFQQECQINQLQPNSSEVAAQLTLRDFQLFQRIEATEYIDELFDLDSQAAHPNLERFSRLVNQEMFWVVSEVVREPLTQAERAASHLYRWFYSSAFHQVVFGPNGIAAAAPLKWIRLQ